MTPVGTWPGLPPATPPFVVMALPRSRTFWLSRFLAPPGRSCGHEELRHARSLDDVRRWLGQPFTGTAETAAAPWWRTLASVRPDARVVVVRRPWQDVCESFTRQGLVLDQGAMERRARGLAAKLNQVAARWPGALVVEYEDLVHEDCCAEVFEHCTGMEHSRQWWEWHHRTNLQGDVIGLLRYLVAFAEPMAVLAARVKQEQLARFERHRARAKTPAVIWPMNMAELVTEAPRLFQQHCEWASVPARAWQLTNWTVYQAIELAGNLRVLGAWQAERLVGYVVTVIGPGLDNADVLEATHTMLFADPALPGLGLRLAREACERLRGPATVDVLIQESTLGDGPRIGLLARRLGAKPDGRTWRMHLEAQV